MMRRALLRRLAAAVLAALMTALLFSSCTEENAGKEQARLVAHFLDVGQGDSCFIELPNGETMLIDAGENYYGENIIRYMRSRGCEKIDYLIASHPHSDHIGSMPYIVRHFDIGEVFMSEAVSDTYSFENLLEAISEKGLRINKGEAGVKIVEEKELTAEITAPETVDEDDLNNSSLIIRITYKDSSFLFLGDAQKTELSKLGEIEPADVLKVGHHGSGNSTSKELLDSVKPKIAVISCGEDNSFGHPHPETLGLLSSAGCEIYRTDKDKTVIVATDGKEYEVKTQARSIVREK